MRYLTLCSGIEAHTVAWKPLGWEPVGFSEVDPFCNAILKHHYPTVPNFGDMTNYQQWNVPQFNVMMAGTPCQGFSDMGLKGGLSDGRSNLMLTFLNAANHWNPDWVLWENVYGALNMADNAFGCLLGGLSGADRPLRVPGKDGGGLGPNGRRWPDCGVVSGPHRTVAWRILDARNWLPQQRRRVFLVATPGPRNFRCAAALFPVSEGLRGDAAPVDQQKTDPHTGVSESFTGHGFERFSSSGQASLCLNAGRMGRIDLETETHVAEFLDGVPQCIRSLTVNETERLQGFEDGYTNIPWHADSTGNRFQAVGNSICVPALRWLGDRIQRISLL